MVELLGAGRAPSRTTSAFSGTFACSDVVNRPAQGINSCEDFEQAFLLNNTYVNVHSTANPGGEIRGQLIRQ